MQNFGDSEARQKDILVMLNIFRRTGILSDWFNSSEKLLVETRTNNTLLSLQNYYQSDLLPCTLTVPPFLEGIRHYFNKELSLWRTQSCTNYIFYQLRKYFVICHSKLQTYKNVFATCSSQICAGMGSNEVHLLLYMYPNTFFE